MEYIEGKGNSFLFKLLENGNIQILKCVLKEKEVRHDVDSMAIFGAGYDLKISDLCNKKKCSGSSLGHSYDVPDGYQTGTD